MNAAYVSSSRLKPGKVGGREHPAQPWRLLVGLALLTSLAAANGWARAPQEQLRQTRRNIRQEKSNLQGLQREIQTEKKNVVQQARQEQSVLSELQQIEKRIEDAEDRYAENQHNLALVQEKLQNLRVLINQTGSRLSDMKALLAIRLRLMYREGSQGLWRILVSAHTLSELLVRLKFFHMVAAQNTYWVERLSQTQKELAQTKRELAEREAQARDLEAESRRALEKIRLHKQKRERVLQRVRNERAAHEEAVRELTVASRRLSELIGRLEQKARELAYKQRAGAQRQTRQAANTGGSATASAPQPEPKRVSQPEPAGRRFPWPTRGRVMSVFGKIRHPRFNTYIFNKGIDIAGPIGQNVSAVAPGRVLFAEWFEGYGRMVILDHGDGFNTIYAHLARISVSQGQTVTENQVIGTLGDSGTWKGPTLYFEVCWRGKALDPLRWLKR